MVTGFTFCGLHSYADYGIICRTVRPILAARNRREAAIPGRNGRIDYGSDTYDSKIFKVDCIIADPSIADLRVHARNVAAWLRKKGNLCFDDDHDIEYEHARVYSAIELEQIIATGRFTVLFETDPIGVGSEHTIPFDGTGTEIKITAQSSGTESAGFILDFTWSGSQRAILSIKGR